MKRKNGFTMVEVALVLTIAGLIFLMAFFALPNLWASQRDTDRKSKITEFVTAIKTYQTNNNRGALPTLSGTGPETFTWDDVRNAPSGANTWKSVIKDYVSVDFEDASGNRYDFYVVKCLDDHGGELSAGQTCKYRGGDFGAINDPENVNLSGFMNYTMYIAVGATCDGDSAIKTNSSRTIAVVQVLERGGRHCYNT